MTIPLYYEGHAYRAGSRIRVTIAAPNGTQPIWAFAETSPKGTAKVAIAYSQEAPIPNLLLPVVSGRQRSDRAAAVPRAARRAVPDLPAVHQSLSAQAAIAASVTASIPTRRAAISSLRPYRAASAAGAR